MIKRKEALIKKVLSASGLSVVIDDSAVYDNGSGNTYQWFIYTDNELNAYIRENWSVVAEALKEEDLELCDWTLGDDLLITIEYDA